ncbi:hypothetical protein MCAP1_000297 [Malassezia caprae]|uniref:Uncharacterized protein n=1 Tax=Malassezia caprae TaxID=1381934 RepID=A0AAF0IYB9_9BASI|nr:hypothetical protein MCAP1_000297 [Malassezia caprae]
MMNEAGGADAPPPMEAIHPTLSTDSMSNDTGSVTQMATYVTDPAQFLFSFPNDKSFTTHVPASLFDECVAVLKRTVQWRVSSTRYNGALPHGRRYAWRKHYVCDHSGKPRDRRDPNLAPGKRRSRRASIKIGCPASFTATQEVGSDTVVMVCRFQHQGHTVNTREYWANSRIPDNVREWIKERVSEGHDQKEIVQMIHEHQKNAANIPPTSPAFIPPGVQITRMDVYNIIKRHKSLRAQEQDTSMRQAQRESTSSGVDTDAHTHRLALAIDPATAEAATVPPPDLAITDRRADEAPSLDPATAPAPYSMLPAAQLTPATPEEAVSFAQQWSDLLANLQALQPQMMEYALTAGTTRQANTTAEWSQAIAQLTQAWYIASNLVDRPVLPPP